MRKRTKNRLRKPKREKPDQHQAWLTRQIWLRRRGLHHQAEFEARR